MKPTAVLFLSLATSLILGASVASAVHNPAARSIQFWGPGVELSRLPGANVLNPRRRVRHLDINLIPARLSGPAGNATKQLVFTAPLYSSPYGTFMFAPTFRLRAGESMTIRFANRLPPADPKRGPEMNMTGLFYGPTDTNLHTHGLHDSNGIQAQLANPVYTGGDNTLITVKPGGKLNTKSTLPAYHLPGLHWIHPHKHGSTSMQTFTANGLIIVEDDPRFLPDARGCRQVRRVMQYARDVVIHLELLTFKYPNTTNVNMSISDANWQTASEYSTPQNPLFNPATGHGVSGAAADQDLLLVNQGWQPKLAMQAGEWQRWRLAHTGYKRYVDLQIVDAAGNLVPGCQIQLLAHDGIYIPALPRPVNHMFLTSGNRAEVLVRCMRPGVYTLTAGRDPSPFGEPLNTNANSLKQAVVMTLAVTPGRPRAAHLAPCWQPLVPRACRPRFPAYATDLSDAALARAGATAKLSPQQAGFTSPNGGPGCKVNGESFTYPDPNPLLMPLGLVVEWNFTGLAGHPVHLHTNPFMIVELPQSSLKANTTYTNWFMPGDFFDTLLLPMWGSMGGLLLRIQPGPFTGYSVMHCHFLQHEDTGCMKMVRWACPGMENSDFQPKVCPGGFTFPVKGDFAPTRILG